MSNKMSNKIVAALLLTTITIMLIIVACKTQKHVRQLRATTDSTAAHASHVRDSTTFSDTGKAFFFERFFSFSQGVDLSIDKLSYTEEESPKVATELRFTIDSLHAHGDTLSTTAENGTKVNIYTDKKTGELVATVKPRGSTIKKYEINNIKLKTDTHLDSGKTLQAAQHSTFSTHVRDSSNKDTTHKTATVQSYDKDVTRTPSVLARLGWLFVAIGAAVIIAFIIKKWSKIKGIFKSKI